MFDVKTNSQNLLFTRDSVSILRLPEGGSVFTEEAIT